MSAGFWLFCYCFYCFFVFFCMIWSNIIIFSPPEHKKHHLNLKWGDLIFWFRPISCTHFATPQHISDFIDKLKFYLMIIDNRFHRIILNFGYRLRAFIKISCVAIFDVLSQNQLSRDLRVFGVKFLDWKWCWCQKWQIWGRGLHCINLVENLNFGLFGDYLHCFVAFSFCRAIYG